MWNGLKFCHIISYHKLETCYVRFRISFYKVCSFLDFALLCLQLPLTWLGGWLDLMSLLFVFYNLLLFVIRCFSFHLLFDFLQFLISNLLFVVCWFCFCFCLLFRCWRLEVGGWWLFGIFFICYL